VRLLRGSATTETWAYRSLSLCVSLCSCLAFGLSQFAYKEQLMDGSMKKIFYHHRHHSHHNNKHKAERPEKPQPLQPPPLPPPQLQQPPTCFLSTLFSPALSYSPPSLRVPCRSATTILMIGFARTSTSKVAGAYAVRLPIPQHGVSLERADITSPLPDTKGFDVTGVLQRRGHRS
jgi:hypothetical protein